MELTVDLNSAQREAIEHVEGPLLVLAGAGSGKTRVVTHRIARLIDLGVLPSSILAVTFTNKAAEEMRTRIRSLKNVQVLASTFHSLGARILRESIVHLGYKSDFVIYDEEDSEKLLKSCLSQLGLSEEKGTLRQLRHAISSAKNDLLDPSEIKGDALLLQVYGAYQSRLKECGALDFDDLLYLTVKLLKENEAVRLQYQNRWQFVLIDEYQDTNLAQYTLAKILVERHGNIFAVGDPDQSIYSWRGARYQNILNFEKDFAGAKVVTLDQNYRSTNTILQASNALISHNPNRYEKKLWSGLGEGAKIGLYKAQSERQEAEFVSQKIFRHEADERISLNDIAIFYRTNAQSRAFEDALLARKINYTIIGGLSFYQRREIKDILSFLKMVISNSDLISFLRTINLPKRGIGLATLEKIVDAAAACGMPVFMFCEELLSRGEMHGIKLGARQREGLKDYLGTIHSLRNKRAHLKVHELISEAVSSSRYLQYLEEDPESSQERKENLDELIGKAAEWEEDNPELSLPAFLEELSLRSNVESRQDLPSVKLMTLHNSKGLEFHLVFVVGLEEDLLPHVNTKGDMEAVEEERRLFYVGMTRAKRKLYLCLASYRFMWGGARTMYPSRFLKEVPTQYLENLSQPLVQRSETVYEPPSEDFAVGDEVVHKEFGSGVIQKAFQGSFGLTYEVYFPATGISRTLAAKYARLQRG